MASKGAGGGASKRKHSALSAGNLGGGGAQGGRAAAKKAAVKAAKRSAAAARRTPHPDDEGRAPTSAREEAALNDELFFESDDDGFGSRKRARAAAGEGLTRRARLDPDGGDEEEDAAALLADEDDGLPPPDPYANETADEKRVRLARDYLRRIEAEIDADEAGAEEAAEEDEAIDDERRREEADEDARGITRDQRVEARLRADLMAQQGKLKAVVAHARYDASSFPLDQTDRYMRTLIGHKKGGGATCIAMTADCAALYSGGKDCNVMAWDTETGKRLYTIYGNRAGKFGHLENNRHGHQAAVLAVSASSDGHYLASGSADCAVKIWDTRIDSSKRYSCVHTFHAAHRSGVTTLAFRLGTHELFTGSTDRTLKLYNIDQMAFVETLYGHTAEVMQLDALYRERCLSVSRDKTARLWKIVEETQLMFRAPPACESLDCVAMVNEDQFLTGGQDGCVYAWTNTKKKPTSIIQSAHDGKWISCVGAQKFTDVCFSGSSDGFLNLYCLESSGIRTNKLNRLHRIPLAGYLNGLVSDARDGRFAAVAVGQEHRMGRWSDSVKSARPGVALISLAGVDRMVAAEDERKAEEERPDRLNGTMKANDEASADADGMGLPNGHAELGEDEEEAGEARFGVAGAAAAAASSRQPLKYGAANGNASLAKRSRATSSNKSAARRGRPGRR